VFIEKDDELTIFMPSLNIGGAEIVVIRLIEGLSVRGVRINLILATKSGELRQYIPEEINIIDFSCSRTVYSLYKLVKYLKKNKPKKLLSHLHRANRIVVLANILSGMKSELYLVNHSTLSSVLDSLPIYKKLLKIASYKILYRYATKIIHVSEGAARDFEKELKMKEGSVKVIYNPIVTDNMINSYNSTIVPHIWFKNKNIPVILSAGGFRKVKGYDVLIEAFYLLQKRVEAKLILLGDGDLRQELENKVRLLKLTQKVYMPGYVNNVYDYMKHAPVFVLSSRREALPTVLVEAMACGCSIVSTDCPNGPAEILENGKYGYLVPVNDPNALSDAIEYVLNTPYSSSELIKRANDFSVKKSIDKYLTELNINTP
jgi:glycosyltransferase involved in cell wall biosynthesis